MKIKGIKMYQAVQIMKKQLTHLSAEAPHLAGLVGPVKMSFVDHMGVLVETDSEAVLVSFNNLAAIFIDKDSVPKSDSKPEPKSKKA